MATFKVDSVPTKSSPLPHVNLEQSTRSRIGGVKPEAFSKTTRPTVFHDYDSTHVFVSAVNLAYAQHYPLVLSPDAIWMCVAQGLSQHINTNAEKLRNMFVEHEGKKEIIVRRDDFLKGSPDNPWPEVFDEFSEQIRKHVGDKTHALLTPEFSTTGPTEKAAAQVVLMDSFKEYFTYMFRTDCGIPEITLEGTVDDWKKLRDRVLGLAQYDLDWWISALKPVLDQFVSAASGSVDREFWSNLYKENGGSGGPYITGWICTLFPYIGKGKNLSRNCYLSWWKETGCFSGITSDSLPAGLVSTPFEWQYYNEKYPMHFYAGFMTVTQDPKTLAIYPEIGWAVADNKEVESVSKGALSYWGL